MIKRLVPKEYRPLLDYISPAAFKVVDWKPALKQFMAMSKLALDKDYVRSLAQQNAKYLSAKLTVNSQPIPEASASSPPEELLAEVILDTYFSQFFSQEGVLLDLRLKHFTTGKDQIVWKPGAFIHVFADSFRRGMLDIYQGYYFDDSDKMEKGMLAVGLVNGTDPELIKETKELLFAHFASADQVDFLFDLDHFKESFHNLFIHLKRNDIQLSSDFLFLGIYLVTLYLAMSKIERPLNVKQIFCQAFHRNKTP